jgi:putative redox protein
LDLITISRESGLEFNVRMRGHELRSDMSEKDGGRDAGPSPAELVASALGCCVAMMVQRYCETHGYEGDVEVCSTLELADGPKRIGSIVVDVELPEGVPDDRKDAVRRVAEKCLVHETLFNPPRVDIEVE